ncbi:MAG: hydantoinase/oxoprolinase family protein [Spirochaetota bacterium]
MYLGLDVGGTHTDAVVIDKSGIVAQTKVVTTHNNLLECINQALCSVLIGIEPSHIKRVNLSTTLTTNAIIENKCEDVAVFVSGGPGINPLHHAIGNYFFLIDGQIDHRGTEITLLNNSQLEKAIKKCRKKGIKVFAVVSKFSTRNPVHEQYIAQKLPHADFICVGHTLSGNLNFPRRIATSYYNAAIWRLYNAFSHAIEESLRELGAVAPINILKADGGTIPLPVSRTIPVESILSGPAASVIGTMVLCDITHDAVMLDIGGTSCDIAMFADGAPLIEKDGIQVNGHNTLVRSLKTKSIGIGGDSAIQVHGTTVTAGPKRLGMSMAEGGSNPTIIDALNVLETIHFKDTARSLEGFIALKKKHGIPPHQIAQQAITYALDIIYNEVIAMINEVNSRPVYTIHEFLKGKVLKPKTIYLIGGPAKTLANNIAQRFGWNVIVPKHCEVANAIGAAVARTTVDIELFADTQRCRLLVPNLNVNIRIPFDYTLDNAIDDAINYMMQYLESIGVDERERQIQIIDAYSFNMVEGFETTGKNIRVHCQVKPGILHQCKDILKL